MKTVYQKDKSGNKTTFEVSDNIADTLAKTRRAIWSSDAYERYYRAASLDAMTDHDERTSCTAANPENIYIAAEQQAELKEKLIATLKSLTPEQLWLVKMLKKGMSVTEIAKIRGVSKQSVSEARERIQKKFEKFLK